MTNMFRTAITCRWGKFIGDALLNSADALNFAPVLSPECKMSLLMGTNNQISATNQQVFPTVNPIDAINWADDSGLCTVSAIREEGYLKLKIVTNTHSGAGAVTNTAVVPAGKKWTIKQLTYYYSPTQTISSYDVSLLNDLGTIQMFLWTAASPVVSVAYYYYAQTPITLTAGWTIKFTTTASAWTSESNYLQILYQESDA
jgi:hypothetical protein